MENETEPLPEPLEITQHAYDLIIEDDFRGSGHLSLHLWCLDRNSNPSLLRVEDYEATAHIELPQFVDGQRIVWDPLKARLIEAYLRRVLGEDQPSRCELVEKTKLYYYQTSRTPCLEVTFRTLHAMKHCSNLLAKPRQIPDLGLVRFDVWEVEISTVRKLFTALGLRYAQWFKALGQEVHFDHELRAATAGTEAKPIREFLVPWRSIVPLPSEATAGWMTCPRLLAFDIETYSDNHKAMPNEFDAKHVVNLISCIYEEAGKPETRKRHLIVLGECDPIPGAEVHSVKDESAMIGEMCQLIRTYDPEIITGFNIFAFDYPYLDVRIKTRMEDWPHCGRLLGRMPTMYSKTWQSGAYGVNRINSLTMEGRISVDMLPIVRREYKLDKYSLDFVAKYFLRIGKHDVKPELMFTIYEELTAAQAGYETALKVMADACADGNGPSEEIKARYTEAVKGLETATTRRAKALAMMKRFGEYCLQDAVLCLDLFAKLNVWIGLLELSSIVGVTIFELFTRGQQIRCQSQIYDLASRLGFVLNKREAAKAFFNGGFVYEPKPGLRRNVICLDFASLYPSIMQAFNVCYTTLVPEDSKIPDELCHVNEFDQEETPDGKPRKRHGDAEGEPEGFESEVSPEEEGDGEVAKTVTRHYRFRFVKKEVRHGILPQLVKRLVDERAAVKKQMKALETRKKATVVKADLEALELQLTILDKRQLALKVSANSMFGFLGAQNGGLMPLIEGAMSITAWGRSLISQVNRYVVEKYGAEIVYGDTDSSMMDLHITDAKECNRLGRQIMDEISGIPEHLGPDGQIVPEMKGLFPPPLRCEFEKAMVILTLKKKKYAYYMINDNGTFVTDRTSGLSVIHKKGIMTARRDNCLFSRVVYDEVLRSVLDGTPIEATLRLISTACARLLRGEVPPRGNLTIIRELGSEYKAAGYFMKVFADELRRMGKPANPGDRLEYIVVRTPEEEAGDDVPLGKKMRAIEMWEDAQKGPKPEKTEDEKAFEIEVKTEAAIYPPEDVDAEYYIEHVLMNPLDQLFEVGYTDHPSFTTIGYKPQFSRCHFVSIRTPVKMIVSIVKDYLRGLEGSRREKLGMIATMVEGLPEWFLDQLPKPPPRRLHIVA